MQNVLHRFYLKYRYKLDRKVINTLNFLTEYVFNDMHKKKYQPYLIGTYIRTKNYVKIHFCIGVASALKNWFSVQDMTEPFSEKMLPSIIEKAFFETFTDTFTRLNDIILQPL